MESFDHIRQLFQKHIDGRIDAAERQELAELAAEHDDEELVNVLEQIAAATPSSAFQMQEWEDMLQHILQQSQPPVVRMKSYKKLMIAASILLAIVIGGYFVFFHKAGRQAEMVQTVLPNDVKAPATNRASITLANGQVVYLDSSTAGQLAQEENANLVKLANGEIVYEKTQINTSAQPVYNTLFNPRGSQVATMTMADGTKVWLNAGSSVTYPVVFNENERIIRITGEAYFEVATRVTAGGAKQSFIAKIISADGKERGVVKVLGTHLNINAYDNEDHIDVTLMEGSVQVERLVIKPGEQARIHATGEVRLIPGVDIDRVMAWKNGLFNFGEATSIQAIMRQVERWYDVEVIYEGNIRQNFGGSTSRQENVSALLQRFTLTETVHFKIEGKKIIVSP